MTTIPIVIVSILQACTAIGFALKRDWPATLVWTGFTIANFGFIWYSIKN